MKIWFQKNNELEQTFIKNLIRKKKQALDVDPKAIQQISFTGNLERNGNTFMFSILVEANENVLDFSQGTVKVL